MLSWLGLILLATSCHGLSRAIGQVACNNSPSLCEKPYSSIVHLGAHDSPFVSYSLAGNQNYDSIKQLGAGVRMLQGQIHDQSGGAGTDIRLCHTLCSLYDAGSLSSWLSSISSWMDSNPDEVVTILLVNSDNNSAAQLDAIFDQSGIKKYAYTYPGSGPWPTLTDMITSNTRLITFIASLGDNTAAPYLLDEFTYVFENAYSVTSSTNFSCIPDRPTTLQKSPDAAIDSGKMFLMNHFLDQQITDEIQLPDKSNAGSTNAPNTNMVGSLGSEMQNCNTQYNRPPNFVLVDWFDVGPSISSVDIWNGVTNPVGRISVNSSVTVSGNASSSTGIAAIPFASSSSAAVPGNTSHSTVKSRGSRIESKPLLDLTSLFWFTIWLMFLQF